MTNDSLSALKRENDVLAKLMMQVQEDLKNYRDLAERQRGEIYQLKAENNKLNMHLKYYREEQEEVRETTQSEAIIYLSECYFEKYTN